MGRPFGWQGSIFSRKRTGLSLVREDRLLHLTNLPRAGDTSCPGVVLSGEGVLISHCTSDMSRDCPWILGTVTPSSIRIARVDLPSLQGLADRSGAPAP